jgi:hypothetical protein
MVRYTVNRIGKNHIHRGGLLKKISKSQRSGRKKLLEKNSLTMGQLFYYYTPLLLPHTAPRATQSHPEPYPIRLTDHYHSEPCHL